MPALQTMLHGLNQLTAKDRICDLREENWGPGQTLTDRILQLRDMEVDGLGPVTPEVMAEVAANLPPAIHDAVREIIRGAISRNQGITFAWRAGYDFKLEITEAIDTDASHGGITVVVESRYPHDDHPIHGKLVGGNNSAS